MSQDNFYCTGSSNVAVGIGVVAVRLGETTRQIFKCVRYFVETADWIPVKLTNFKLQIIEYLSFKDDQDSFSYSHS